MVKVIKVDDNGDEVAVIEIDDFTVEVIYAGIADALREAASAPAPPAPPVELSAEARRRRERVLQRIQA